MRSRYLSGLALLGLPYLGYVAATWWRYGRPTPPRAGDASPLDAFLPHPEVAERHETEVLAPAAVTFAAARELDIQRSPLVRAIFAVRTLPAQLGGAPARQPESLLSETQALGWRILAETPGRSIVLGAVTQPWRAAVRFRPRKLSIPRGATVRWRFQDPILHDVTLASGPRAFASAYSDRGATYRKRFTVRGEYRIFCSLHPVAMSQIVRVR